jgi:hypothetical protein
MLVDRQDKNNIKPNKQDWGGRKDCVLNVIHLETVILGSVTPFKQRWYKTHVSTLLKKHNNNR